jgi:tetratricopeptide (TPR) repeat protein
VLLALVLAACGGPGTKSTLPTVPTQPGDDLARAQAGATPGAEGADDPRLGTAGIDGGEPEVTDLDTIRISVVGKDLSGEPELEAVAAANLLAEGAAAAAAGEFPVAIGTWRRLVTEFPDSKHAPTALWNIAAVEEKRGDTNAEIAALRELVAGYPTRREAVEAHLYIAALESERARWPAAKATLDEVVARTDLTYADRIEAFARRGYVLMEQGDVPAAAQSLEDAIATWRKAPRVIDPYFIAMAHFYRGEVARRQFVAAPIRKQVATAALHDDLAVREKLAAAAYDRWRETLAFNHAYWSTAAGYQMSQIFVEFWQATVKAPYPTDLAEAARTKYVAEVHDRVRDHLEKALEGHRMNVELAGAFGVDTQWSDASKQRAAEVMTLLAQEAAGHYVTPDP